MVFGKESTAGDVIAGHDLSGQMAVVTGGTSGIGLETAGALARVGARVVVTGRDPDKGSAAVARLRGLTTNPAVSYEYLDLAKLSDIARFVRGFLATTTQLHLLINNAGVFTTTRHSTPDGFELQFGVNHLGHFALTLGLLPVLREAGTARVITISSRAHHYGDVDFDDPNFERRDYDNWLAYGQSKTANALFAVGVTEHGGIPANTVMPGMAMTDLFRLLPLDELAARGWTSSSEGGVAPGWKTVPQAAATTVWAAVAPELDGRGGHYLEDCAIARPWHGDAGLPVGHYRPYALDSERAERLWTLSSKLTGRVT